MGRAAVRRRDVAIKPHALEKLERELKKYEVEAVEKLAQLMRESDDPKTVVKCADILLAMREKVSKTIDASEINRLVISMKTTQHLSAVPEDSTPRLDFSTIAPEFQVEEEIITINMEDIKSIG